MAYHGPSYGLDADLERKRVSSYDSRLEAEVRGWIESRTGERCGGRSFHEYLKSGIVLCKLMNTIRPGSCRFQQSTMPFKIMENINAFLDAARDFGVPSSDLFQTVDLYEAKNMNQVLQCLSTIKRKAGGGIGSPTAAPAAVPWAHERDASTCSPNMRSPPPSRSTPSYSRPGPSHPSGPSRAPAPSSPSSSSGPNFCPNCGSKCAGMKFCGNCGTKLM